MIKNETQRFGKTKRDFVILAVLATIIAVANILVYIGLSNQMNSLQSRPTTVQTICGTLEQRPYPRFYENPPSGMVLVVSPTPNCGNPFYLSRAGNPIRTISIEGIYVDSKVEVDGLIWNRSDEWGNETFKMLEWFSMRKR